MILTLFSQARLGGTLEISWITYSSSKYPLWDKQATESSPFPMKLTVSKQFATVELMLLLPLLFQ